jgi:DNA-binding transcriptional regulator YhcF (GntR family)
LTTEQGSGTFVAGTAPQPVSGPVREAKLKALCAEFLAQAARYGFAPADVHKAIRELLKKDATS